MRQCVRGDANLESGELIFKFWRQACHGRIRSKGGMKSGGECRVAHVETRDGRWVGCTVEGQNDGSVKYFKVLLKN